MIKAVIFDVDGTLLDTEHIYLDAWRAAGHEAGYEIPDEALMRTRAIDRTLAAEIFKSLTDQAFDYWGIWQRRRVIAEAMIAQRTAALARPGAMQALDWLGARGMKKAIATMTDAETTRVHLEKAGMAGRFDAEVTCEQVKRGKPDPEIFLLAAARMGVQPSECLVCEDAYAGVQAAINAGMIPVMIPDVVPARESERACAHILNSLSELPELIDSLSE